MTINKKIHTTALFKYLSIFDVGEFEIKFDALDENQQISIFQPFS